MILEEKMILGFCEAEPGTEFDIMAEVVRADPDGSCALWFFESLTMPVMDYSPWVIQAGIFSGTIIVKEEK